MGRDVCQACRKGTDQVPLCLYTVEKMDGTVSEPTVMCPNCAERIYRLREVFRAEREGEIR